MSSNTTIAEIEFCESQPRNLFESPRQFATIYPSQYSSSQITYQTRLSMTTTNRRLVLGFAFLLLSLPVRCWSDDPKSSQQVETDIFALDWDAIKAAAEDEATESSQPTKKEAPDYRVALESGETIDIGEIFKPELDAFQASLRKRAGQTKTPMIRVYDESSEKPLLLVERRGAVLHGLLATFAQDGSPIAHASYERGNRTATLFTWDELKRPLVFEQYAKGKLDGIRGLFRGCCDECTDGHPWLVQQWQEGKLRSAHLVLDSGKTRTFKYLDDSDGQPYGGSTTQLDAAMVELEKFHNRLRKDEKQLKLVASRAYEQDKLQKQLVSQQRNDQFASRFRSSAFTPVGVSGRSGSG